MDEVATFATLDKFKTVIELAGAAFGIIVAIGTIWWKMARLHAETMINLESIEEQLKDLIKSQKRLTESMIRTTTRLEMHEKDMVKLEASFELHRKDFTQMTVQVGTLGKAVQQMQKALQQKGMI